MIRLALRTGLGITLIAVSVAAHGQAGLAAATPLQRAALDMPVASSSSSTSSNYDLFAVGSRQATSQTVNRPQGSTRAFSSLGIGAKVSTQGIGFDVATPLVPGRLNLRGGATFFSYSTSTSTDNLNINGTLKLRNGNAMIDWYPWAGSFRISGGAGFYNNTGLFANIGVPAGQTFTLGNTTYYSSQTQPLAGTANFLFGGNAGGRVSLGWGNMVPRMGHFRFETEVGAQFESAPTVQFTFTGQGCTTSPTTGCGPVNQSDVTAEQNKLQNDLNGLKVFPVVSLGLSYSIH